MTWRGCATPQLPASGVALPGGRLGTAWLESGRLVRLSRRSVEAGFQHYIRWRPVTVEQWEYAAFVDWSKHALAVPRFMGNTQGEPDWLP